MWFKNLRVYRLTDNLMSLQLLELDAKLQEFAFSPCASLDPWKYGFVPVVGDVFAHQAAGFTIFCAKLETKLLPSSVINEQIEAKAKSISEAESRSVGRKEKQTLKDEIIFSLLPKAFTKSTLTHAYIDHKEQLLVINSSSVKVAEDLCGKLREALGSLRAIPLSAKNVPTQVMTHWVQTNELPANFELGFDIELHAGKDERVVRCKKQDLSADEVLSHINSGMFVSKLAIDWREGVSFIIDDQLAIKRLKFGDSITDQANERNPESKAEQFDADFSVMTAQLRPLINEIIAAFGGESEGV
jgi:recombination associated protein RdgC